MDSLRVILLFIGAVFILGLYLWYRYQQRPRRPARPRRTVQETPAAVQPDPEAEDVDAELARMGRLLEDGDAPATGGSAPSRARESTDKEAPLDSLLVIISVMAPAETVFSGDALLKALKNNGLVYDQQQYYKRIVASGDTTAVFSVANAVKPGSLPYGDAGVFSSPGITMFLQLPGPVHGLSAFNDLLTTAQRIAVELGGQLQDQNHEALSEMKIAALRDNIEYFGRSVRP